MSISRAVELEGHIIDSGMMSASFGMIMEYGGSFDLETFDIGTFVPDLADRLLE